MTIANQVSKTYLSVFRLLCAGVAFYTEATKRYEIYSHEGEYLGSLSQNSVQSFICTMRKQFGIEYQKVPHSSHSVTYGHNHTVLGVKWREITKWMSLYTRFPIHLN